MTSAASTRRLVNDLGAYFGREPIPPIEQIETVPAMLNPRAWPRCKHCGGNVHCEQYEPDMSGPLWSEEA